MSMPHERYCNDLVWILCMAFLIQDEGRWRQAGRATEEDCKDDEKW